MSTDADDNGHMVNYPALLHSERVHTRSLREGLSRGLPFYASVEAGGQYYRYELDLDPVITLDIRTEITGHTE